MPIFENFPSKEPNVSINNDGLMTKEDKIKLDAIEDNANNYVHPDNATTRHITDTERTTWNAKASTAIASTTTNGLMSKEDKIKLDRIAEDATKYVHPDTHPATMITEDTTHRFVTDTEKATWNAKASTKADVGLGNVTNDAQVKRSEMGANNGVATLDASGKIPSTQLPSYVDDVLEYAAFASFPVTGESGKIYVDTATNKTYRWSGTQYTNIASDLALGETAVTAYAGNKGKANADEIAKIKNGTTVVPKATDAATVNGKTVAVSVPAGAKFTDTTYNPATSTTDGLMSKTDKIKLDNMNSAGIETMTYTMPASEFTSNGKVKIAIPNITTETEITIGLNYETVTLAQYDAAGLAKFVPKIVADGIEVSCFGTKPTIDIPVAISIARKTA